MANQITDYFKLESFHANSLSLLDGDFRLNAEYYEENKNINLDKNIVFEPLSNLATVVFPGIFKRFQVENGKNGIGFLTTSEMMMIEPIPEKFLSIDLTHNLDIYRVTENTLLVSRSGSIGNTIYVNNDLIDLAITEDALRVRPFDSNLIGLLYFYFISDYGNSQITGKKSGAVIDHIYEDDLYKIPIPILNSPTIQKFYDIFQKVKTNRETANALLRNARSLVLQYNNLPSLSEAEIETIDPKKEVEIRKVNISEFTSDYRLDAHFYNPMAKKAVDNINQFSQNNLQLKELTSEIILGKRFKRNYVESEHGTPFLSGKNIIQIRPSDLKHLSNTEISFIDELQIKKNWTLITCSGTLGRTCFVYNNYEDYAASQHILRIVPKENEVDAGYLYCFLSTDYGYHQIIRNRYGSVIDEIDDKNMETILIPVPKSNYQKEIGDLVRQAYDLRAEAIKLEDEAQEILTKALTGK